MKYIYVQPNRNNGTYSLTLLYHTEVDTCLICRLFFTDENVHSMATGKVYFFKLHETFTM
jgi:hypothetical protein